MKNKIKMRTEHTPSGCWTAGGIQHWTIPTSPMIHIIKSSTLVETTGSVYNPRSTVGSGVDGAWKSKYVSENIGIYKVKHPLTEEQSKLRSSQVLWHTDRKTYRDIQTSKWTKNYVIRYLISGRPRHKTYMILENLCTCTGYIKTHQNSCNLWGVSRVLKYFNN